MSKKTLTVFTILIAASLLFVAFQLYRVYQAKQVVPASGDAEAVINKELGVSFTYKKGPDGFTLVEPNGEDRGIVKSYLLMPTKEFEAYKTQTGAGEAPANISLFVFTLDTSAKGTTTSESRISQLQTWASDNASFTSIKLAKNTPDIIELDGVKALHYKADGLYQQDIYLAAYRGYVYMFVSQYDAETDMTYTAFQELLQSVTFD